MDESSSLIVMFLSSENHGLRKPKSGVKKGSRRKKKKGEKENCGYKGSANIQPCFGFKLVLALKQFHCQTHR